MLQLNIEKQILTKRTDIRLQVEKQDWILS